MNRAIRFTLVLWLVSITSVVAQPRWWMDEPVRLLQTNLREIDSTLDAQRLVRQVAEFPANTLLLNLGGIVAQYPTRVEFHYASPHLPPGRDLFGEALKEARARGVRVIGRFDLSKTQKAVFDARPEWFFKRVNGEPAIYNGLYSACINGGYYREHAPRILTEALERYESDNVNRARNSEPGKMAFNLCMSFVDYPWRFVTVPQGEIQLRLYQNLAHGGPPAMAMLGTMDQEDRHALMAAQPVFEWHARREDLYVGQQSAARVLLLRGNQNSYRGFFRLLSEQHIPFAVSDNLKWLDDPERAFDLVIAPSGAAVELDRYVRTGGRLLIAGPTPPALPVGKVIGARPHTQGSWRVHDHTLLPSLKNTRLLFLDGEYLEIAPLDRPLLTLIPPAMFGPPEKVWVNKVETHIPGLVLRDHGKGRIAYIPWDVGGLYYRHSSQGHGGLMADVIDHLSPQGRQLKTDAHPLVEITVMRQPRRNRTLVHLVNLSGHADTAYFAPIEMRNITVEMAGGFRSAMAAVLNRNLRVTGAGRYRRFTLPRLKAYEVVVVE